MRPNAAEAAALGAVPVIGIDNLGEAMAHLSGVEARVAAAREHQRRRFAAGNLGSLERGMEE